jgi:hypothetical protein
VITQPIPNDTQLLQKPACWLLSWPNSFSNTVIQQQHTMLKVFPAHHVEEGLCCCDGVTAEGLQLSAAVHTCLWQGAQVRRWRLCLGVHQVRCKP